MARKPRLEREPGVHHVYARGNDRRAIFVDDVDRHRYLARLGAVTDRLRWRCLAYCLMPNHVHLLVETREPNLGRGVQLLHGGYAQRFHLRHGGSGHLFQGRYGAVAMQTDAQLLVTARYIAVNPVAAGLCTDPADWPWGSHAAVIAADPPPWLDVSRLLEYVDAPDPRRRYAAFVDDRPPANA